MYRLLLDTNILLDAILPNRPERAETREVISRCNGGDDLGIACSLSLKDVYHIVSKLYDRSTARRSVEWLTRLLAIGPISAEECLDALSSNEPDYEDAIIRSCAELNDIDFIITRDREAFAGSRVRSLSAKEYLDKVVGA